MVWGCMSAAGVGKLVVVDGTLDSDTYIQILKEAMIPSAQALHNGYMVFQQDNAPAHTSKKTKTFLQEHRIQVLPWPAKSPDLNPIENLWQILESKVRPRMSSSLVGLKEALMDEWKKISKETCQKLIQSLPKRCKACTKARGGHFQA
jgi:transposase